MRAMTFKPSKVLKGGPELRGPSGEAEEARRR